MRVDLTGNRYGKLTVIGSAGYRGNIALWECRCDCGGTVRRSKYRVVTASNPNCGCEHHARTHGHTVGRKSSPTFSSWNAMIGRCTHQSSAGFEHYQQMGVTVCSRWRHGEDGKSGFECFLEDMGGRPSLKHSLDRHPDNGGNYEPGNCRWASKKQQGNNRSTNKTITYLGREWTLEDLAAEAGLPKETLRHRIRRAGWPIEKAISAPKAPGRRVDILGA